MQPAAHCELFLCAVYKYCCLLNYLLRPIYLRTQLSQIPLMGRLCFSDILSGLVAAVERYSEYN